MIKIAVGTTSEQKNATIYGVLSEAGIQARLFPIEVESGVQDQPKEEKETRQGSINRAREALAKVKDAEIGLGIEIGYEPIDEKYYMHGWASIIDKNGNIYSEQSSTMELPKFLLNRLAKGESLGDFVREFAKLEKSSEWKQYTDIFIFREPFIRESVRNVILRYCFRNEY